MTVIETVRPARIALPNIDDIADKVYSGERLTFEDGRRLFAHPNLPEIASLATDDRESIAALIAAMKRRPIRYALLDLDYHTGLCKQIDFEGDAFGTATERQFVAAHRHGHAPMPSKPSLT